MIFFHFALHVPRKLRKKIEKGRYVDLAKLLRKTKTVANKNEKGVELISKDGRSFLIPASNKDAPAINSFRKWKQTFGVCAGIFVQIHPHRAHEMFQHISNIREQAQTFIWDNVYDYDIIFHELMGKKPIKELGVLYQQGYMARLKDAHPTNGRRDQQSTERRTSNGKPGGR